MWRYGVSPEIATLHSAKSTQPGHPSTRERNEYQRKLGCKQLGTLRDALYSLVSVSGNVNRLWPTAKEMEIGAALSYGSERSFRFTRQWTARQRG